MILIAGEGRTIELVAGDLTSESTDAIVNAANSSLLGGGGVDGAIHRVGGPAIVAECRAIVGQRGTLPPGEAVITSGGKLRAKFVIHTVGPIWEGGTDGEAETLARCYRSSMTIADENRLVSLAFPSISTGAYGYPIDLAAPVALRCVQEVLRTARTLRHIRFVLFDLKTLAAYERAASTISPD